MPPSTTPARAAASSHPQREVPVHQRRPYELDSSSSDESDGDDDEETKEPQQDEYMEPQQDDNDPFAFQPPPPQEDEPQPQEDQEEDDSRMNHSAAAARTSTTARRVTGHVTKLADSEDCIRSVWPERMPQLGDCFIGPVDRDATGREQQLYHVVKTSPGPDARPLELNKSTGKIIMSKVDFRRDMIHTWLSSTACDEDGVWTEEPRWVGKMERYRSWLFGEDGRYYAITKKEYDNGNGKPASHVTQRAKRFKLQCGKVESELLPTTDNHPFVGAYWSCPIPSFQLEHVFKGEQQPPVEESTTPASKKRKTAPTSTATTTKRLKFQEQAEPMERAVGFVFDAYLAELRKKLVRDAKEKGVKPSELLVDYCDKLGHIGRVATHRTHHGREAETMERFYQANLDKEPLVAFKRQMCRYHAATSASAHAKLQELYEEFLGHEEKGTECAEVEPVAQCMDLGD